MELWPLASVLAAAARGFAEAEAELALEQAVRDLDSRDELGLHPLLAAAFQAAGFGAHREARYPRDRIHRRRTEGARCDLVLTPAGRPLIEDVPQLGLFHPAAACPLAEALWLEVKVIAQFREGGANRGYERALKTPVWRDVDKLAGDAGIRHGGVLVVLFTAQAEVAEHDLGLWCHLGRIRGLRFGTPLIAHVPIGDRLGNALATVALVPLDPM
jgi:hypothetical protein